MSRPKNGGLEETMRSLKLKVLSFKEDNVRLVKE